MDSTKLGSFFKEEKENRANLVKIGPTCCRVGGAGGLPLKSSAERSRRPLPPEVYTLLQMSKEVTWTSVT